LSPLRGCGTVNCVIPFFFFLFGIVLGSFLNVCISRIPERISIVSPASHCPRCKSPIKPYDNIPVFSWLLLRGKCRNCHLPISPMYPIVEFLTGALFVGVYFTYHVEFALGMYLPIVKCLFFVGFLVILIVTDLRVRLLPDAVNWFGFGLALAFATVSPPNDPSAYILAHKLHFAFAPKFVLGVLNALLGAAFGSLLLLGAATLYKLVRRREGMGLGDVKMMAMVGAFLGVRGAFLTILIGTLLGSVLGLGFVSLLYLFGWRRDVAERAHRRGLGSARSLRWALAAEYQLPLGSFLGIAGILIVLIFGSFMGGPIFHYV
jgi:leader peptidase (prepilin peptidase)/N-methyltransferase